MGHHLLRRSFVVLAILLGPACSSEPPKPAAAPATSPPEDHWKHSALWLHATKGAAGGAKAECEHVQGVLSEESRCTGKLCKYAVELADEWEGKCAKLAPDGAEEVAAISKRSKEQKRQAATPCSREHDKLLRAPCDNDACAHAIQQWVTRCAESEAGPLAVSLLARVLERGASADFSFELDTRGCASIAAAVRKAATCADENACREQVPEIEALRARCLKGDTKPALATALAMQAVAFGAGQEVGPIEIAATASAEAREPPPLAFADGSGALLGVCGRRVFTLDEYLQARARCAGAPITFARVAEGTAGERVLRVGQVPIPDGIAAPILYPALELAGELEVLGKAKAREMGAQLDEILGAGDLARLVKLVDEQAGWIGSVEAVRAELRARDAKLTSLLQPLGAAKAMALRGNRDVLAQRSFLARSRAHALADVSVEGRFVLGAATRAALVDTEALWPTAMQAYRVGLAPVERAVQTSLKPRPADLDKQLERSRAQAAACAAAVTAHASAEKELFECAFGGCDDARRAELIGKLQRARSAAEAARRELDDALGALDAGTEAPPPGAAAACVPPKW